MSAKVNRSVTIHQGKILKMVSENITLANGVSLDIAIIRHPGASAIIPLSDKNTVILLKQYRHAIGDYIWEIPAGTFKPNEEAIVCAQRELAEETGYLANEWQKLGEIMPLPGYSDERIHLFLAMDLVLTDQNLDRDEMLDVHEIEIDNALKMIYQGDIQDSKTISGIFMAIQWFEQKGIH